ncbi:Z-ring formation inhibitor MciZ [Bacillus sp. CGMCC 1.16607]
MKVYVHEKGVVLVGKAWEIKQKLIEYRHKFVTVKDWVNDTSQKSDL